MGSERPLRRTLDLKSLRAWHAGRRAAIRARLAEFRAVGRKNSRRGLFREIVYCIYAANTSAELAGKAVKALDCPASPAGRPRSASILFDGDLKALMGCLHSGHFRFWRRRAEFIFTTREHIRRLESAHGVGLGRYFARERDPVRRRELLAKDPGFKGIGYKEASHFLRNIGYHGYAILDKHIINCLEELHVLPRNPDSPSRPSSPKCYLEIEEKMRRFASRAGIDMDELDLALWSFKTGKILK